jgi:hypothetical protein
MIIEMEELDCIRCKVCNTRRTLLGICSLIDKGVKLMACAEGVYLKETYDAAFCAWLRSRDCLLNGVGLPRTTYRYRKQLLQLRLKSANNLYEHSRTCGMCKGSDVNLIDDMRSCGKDVAEYLSNGVRTVQRWERPEHPEVAAHTRRRTAS